jgi:hypothetical protein
VSRSGQRGNPPVKIEALFPVFLTTAALAVCWTAVLWSPRFTSDPASWQKHLADAATEGLDQAQLRTIVRVLDQEPSLAPVWNWQMRGVRRYVQPARDPALVPAA